MGLNVGSKSAGNINSFQKLSINRFAYRHLFVVESVDGINSSSKGGQSMPSLFVLRGTFPYRFINVASVERNNSNIYYPDVYDVNQLEIEFYETSDNIIWNYFEEWFESIFSDDGQAYNLPSKFKRDIMMFRLDNTIPEGTQEFSRVFCYKYFNCFPIRISDYILDQSDPGVVTLGITFSADSVKRMTGSDVLTQKSNDRSAMKLTGDSDLNKKTAEARAEAKSFVGDLVGEWTEAIIKAGINTGVNIAKREAAYMAYYLTGRNKLFTPALGAGRDIGIIAKGLT